MKLHVISGAQTGADVAGLWAAKLFNLSTGGYAPKNFATLDGSKPEMAKTFGILEHSAGYRQRTIANLKNSNLTIVFSEKMSTGTKLTINQCLKEKKPCYVAMLDPSDLEASLNNENLNRAKNFIKNSFMIHDVITLNVAGNSTQNSARAFEFAYKGCYLLFKELGFETTAGYEDWNIYKDLWSL